MNLVSRSLVILRGNPCFEIISLKRRVATTFAVAGSAVGRNLAILLNLSMTTKTPVCPEVVKGKSVRKSIAMSCHGPAGVGRGCSSPAGFCVDLFPVLADITISYVLGDCCLKFGGPEVLLHPG